MSPKEPVLVLIDCQEGFHDAAFWGPRNNPDAEDNVAGHAVATTLHDHVRPPAGQPNDGRDEHEFSSDNVSERLAVRMRLRLYARTVTPPIRPWSPIVTTPVPVC